MKIYNNPVKLNTYASSNTNFKGGRISSVALKNLEQVKNNPKTNDLFIKLASVLGLTAILGWVKSLTEKNNTEGNNKLDIIDTEWANKNNALLLGSETKDKYLDVLSRADEMESILWTKALISNDNSHNNTEISTPNTEATELFLSKDSNETFMAVSANKAINSILMQINALDKADEKTRESFMKDLESKLYGLIKQVDSLQNDVTKSELYAKLANITKAFVMYNILRSEQSPKATVTEIIESEKTTALEETTTSEPSIVPEENPVEKVVELKTVTPVAPVELPVTVPEKIEIPEEMKPSIKVVDKIDLKDDGVKRFRDKGNTPVEKRVATNPGEIVITDENREFVTEKFLKAFKKTSPIKPETYSAHLEFIQMIYDSYAEEKVSLKKGLLERMSNKDLRYAINKYFDFTNGKIEKLDFLNFLTLEEFKEQNGGELTKKDFDIINGYKDTVIKYYQIFENNIKIFFNPGVSAEKRLEVIRDLHMIAYNIEPNKILKGNNQENISLNDLIHELSYKLAKDSYEYPNIIRFLNVDTYELPETETRSTEEDDIEENLTTDLRDNYEDIKEILSNAKYRARLNELLEAIKNPDFDGLIETPHARMRFLERYVFSSDSRLLSKNAYEVKKRTSKKLETLRQNIEGVEYISFTNYPAKNDSKANQKHGPRLYLKNCTIGLNDKAQIHTIWDR